MQGALIMFCYIQKAFTRKMLPIFHCLKSMIVLKDTDALPKNNIFKIIHSSALSFLCGSARTSVHDYWKTITLSIQSCGQSGNLESDSKKSSCLGACPSLHIASGFRREIRGRRLTSGANLRSPLMFLKISVKEQKPCLLPLRNIYFLIM